MVCRTGLLLMAWIAFLPLAQAAEFSDLDRGHGLQLYRNYCMACHGDDGRGSAIAREDLEPDPPVLLARKDLTPAGAFMRIRHGGRSMPQMHDELSDADIWNIVYALPLIRQVSHANWVPGLYGRWHHEAGSQ
ncbi:MAG: c-type cytochrome [Mariprofundaceae bacterium]